MMAGNAEAFDLSQLYANDGEQLRFEAEIVTGNDTATMALRERATGQIRTVVVHVGPCSGCGGVHAYPVSMLLDRNDDISRFEPPPGFDERWR